MKGLICKTVLLIRILVLLMPASVRGQLAAIYVEEDYETGASDYYANFLRMAQWLTMQQQTNGAVQLAEDDTLAVTASTTESIWTWSHYAGLTGDYAGYLQGQPERCFPESVLKILG